MKIRNFIFCLFFVSCASLFAGSRGERISLESGWEYTLDNPFGSEENTSFVPLEDVELKNLEKLVPGEYGSIWIRKRFVLPESLKNQNLACYLGRITLADRTYLNGTMIGHEGLFPPECFSAWNTARFYAIPDSDLLQDEENTLIVEVFVNGEGSVVSFPFIGTFLDARRKYAYEQFWNSRINIIFAFIMIVLAAYHFMLWNCMHDERENLWFAGINLITALYMSVFYLSELPGFPHIGIPFLWYQKIFSSGLLFLLPFLIQSFINSFFRRHDNKIVHVFRVAFVLVPLVFIFAARDYVSLRHMREWINPLIIPPIIYIVAVIAWHVLKQKKDSVPLLIGFSPLLFTSLFDVIIHDVFHMYSIPYFSSMGWQLVILALLFVLAKRFTRSRMEAEYLNVHLKDEVAARTKELTESNSQLTVANEKLESARIVAERDMKLAVYVQQSFYPRKAPELDDWEIAYTFRPMSGVSGDLYDFFTTGKKLNGIALFDVSGHGIASGLVTMLSKSVVFRCFTSDETLNLAAVMKNINEGIVKEKGDIENYLTGLLLRVDGNMVKYVNAGHPVSFLRTAKSGKSYPLQLKNASEAGAGFGAVIGIPGMDLDVHSIQFEMKSGDALIMYTDCLSESKNTDGEEYGQERVSKVFSDSGNGSARDKLEYILRDYEEFTSGTEVKDDLTVIILQKK